MPPFAELGFTSELRQTLIVSRAKLDEWIELQKAEADAVCEQYRQTRSLHQQRLDQTVTSLLAAQLESGLSVAETSGSSANSQKKQDFLEKQQQIREQIAKYQAKLSEKQALVEGAYRLYVDDVLMCRSLDSLVQHRDSPGEAQFPGEGDAGAGSPAPTGSRQADDHRRLDLWYCQLQVLGIGF